MGHVSELETVEVESRPAVHVALQIPLVHHAAVANVDIPPLH
jgi:hypothetical protein